MFRPTELRPTRITLAILCAPSARLSHLICIRVPAPEDQNWPGLLKRPPARQTRGERQRLFEDNPESLAEANEALAAHSTRLSAGECPLEPKQRRFPWQRLRVHDLPRFA